MNKEDFLALLSKKISTGLDRQEQIDYDLYLHRHADYKPVADRLRAYVNQSDSVVSQAQQANLQKIWMKLGESSLPQKKLIRKTSIIGKIVRLGAVAALLLFVIWYSSKEEHNSTIVDVTSFTEMASGKNKSLVSMVDGTIVTLDRNATLFVNTDFGQQQREAKLVGNARFDVVKNPDIPMRIHLNNWEVVVTGTSFDIIQDTLLDQNELTLFNGEVILKPADSSEKTLKILPNQKVTWKSENQHISDVKVSQLSEIERINNQNQFRDSIVFKNQRFIDLAKKIQEIYTVTIFFENKELQRKRFSGVLYKMSLEEFLDALKATYPFEYERQDSMVIIR
ncbi:FecR family protein [Sphingobacterium alkalisoli]|uniref:FecR family protein n=1 Tax=Sphingobacterium alkalisoli TaxID=1874115 RepID=A0A4U0H266_9SPHI|nr:FecR family protein [Sphingobacterium alkalisoli]TJY65711.1 FecR family protein [Sphingobacterium alkalisoli]GGH18789.1 hypothetical protein GCM10011418_22700 [Sphingobacterium alkalisoli]